MNAVSRLLDWWDSMQKNKLHNVKSNNNYFRSQRY